MANFQSANANTDTVAEELKNFTCPICLDLYDNPVHINCGHKHIYCLECVQEYQHQDQPACPQCREQFDPHDVMAAKDLIFIMKQTITTCIWCSEKMKIFDLKIHLATCSKQHYSIKKFEPIAETKQEIQRDLPNRSTFSCPLCGLKNLLCSDLVKHCNEKHQHETSSLVCPICASMPWGDPNLRSTDFIQHLNLRHKFEYDTYVDFNQDDDEMLRRALQESLQEC